MLDRNTKMPLTGLDTGRILVAPSILAADFSMLGEEIKRVYDAGCDLLHLDVMDGHFVPNLTMGPPLVSSIRKCSKLSFDTHLMLTNPLKYVDSFIKAGADHITFHIESDDEPLKVIEAVRERGCSVGVTMKPGTPADDILSIIDKVDLVLVMTVEPGFGGQSFMSEMIPKISAIAEVIRRMSLNVHLEVDGGIDEFTAPKVVQAGANMLVAGTSVFRAKDGAAAAIEKLHATQKLLPGKK